MAYPNALFSAFAFIGFLMCAIPLPWHLEAWNTGTCLYMIWAGLACLFQFVNSVVWNGNAINWSPVWCDISSRFIIGTSWAIPAASLCINRRLYNISSVQYVTITKAEKRRGVMIDLAIGVGLPVLGMILQYIPQGHRFNIFEDIGCYPFTYNTPVAYALVFCPAVIIGLVSAVYGVLSVRAFNKSRTQFNELLSSYSNLTSSRYIRLMCLSGIEILCTVPPSVLAIVLNVKAGVNPWISWENVHFGFSRVDQIPSIEWRASQQLATSLELSRWPIIVCAFIFFGFFGFADEAKKHYRTAFQTVAKSIGLASTFSSSSTLNRSTGGKFKTSSISSLPDVSIGDVSGYLKEDPHANENASFPPTLSYGAITLPDVRGILADYEAPMSHSSKSYPSSFVSSSTLNRSTGGKFKTTASAGKVRPIPPTFAHADFPHCHSLTDVSIGFGNVSGNLNENPHTNEKASPTLSYGAITLPDVGGTLADYEAPISHSSHSNSSTSSVMSTPETTISPALPDPSHKKSNTDDIV